MASKRLKLDEEAISEILVADTDSASDAEFRDVEKEEEEEEVEEEEQQQVVEFYHSGDRLKEGTQMYILSSVQQKV